MFNYDAFHVDISVNICYIFRRGLNHTYKCWSTNCSMSLLLRNCYPTSLEGHMILKCYIKYEIASYCSVNISYTCISHRDMQLRYIFFVERFAFRHQFLLKVIRIPLLYICSLFIYIHRIYSGFM